MRVRGWWRSGLARSTALVPEPRRRPSESRRIAGHAGWALLTAVTIAVAIAGPGRSEAQQLVGSPRADFGKVVLSDRQAAAGGATFEANIGAYNNEPVANYGPEAPFVKLGRAVGRLDVLTDAGVFPCTAFLISERHILTNHHCVPGIVGIPEAKASRIDAAQMVFGYTVEGVSEGTRSFVVSVEPVESDEALDYSILEVAGSPGSHFGHLRLSSAATSIPDNYPYWIIGHPLKGPQRISREQCKSAAPAIAGERLRHTCDTLPGNSGSPVIDPETKAVVALHHAGSARDAINYAIPIELIAARSRLLASLTDDAIETETLPDAATPGNPFDGRWRVTVRNAKGCPNREWEFQIVVSKGAVSGGSRMKPGSVDDSGRVRIAHATRRDPSKSVRYSGRIGRNGGEVDFTVPGGRCRGRATLARAE